MACAANPLPDFLDVLLNPTGVQMDAGLLAIAAAKFFATSVEQRDFAACRSRVDSYEDILRHSRHRSPLERYHPLGQSCEELRS